MEKIGYLYENNKISTYHQANYNLYFIIRRQITILVLVYMDFWSNFQCAALVKLSIMNLAYLLASRPLLTREENNFEMFNELSILISGYLMMNFLNVAMPLSFANWLGWIHNGIVGSNIVANLLKVMGYLAKDLIK